MKNKKGITLVSLIITIVILLILASIATYSGISVIKSSRLTAFVTELKIMQTQVNAMYEENGGKDPLGEEIIKGNSEEVAEKASIVFTNLAKWWNKQNGESKNAAEIMEEYKYWSKEKIQELGIDVEQSFFVNLKKRSVVSSEGFEYEGVVYYTLEQFEDSSLYSLYNVEYKQPNEGEPTFTVEKEYIGSDKWRITISKINYNDGYIDKWEVKYKLLEQENWNTSRDLSFVINQQGTYEIKIENNDITSEPIKQTITKEYAKNGLLLHYDAINNIGEGDDKHSTTTNVWKDLSGNENDAQLKNFDDNSNKWGDNCLQLDGINDYAEVADNSTITPTAQTIEVVFNRTGNTEHLGRGIIFVKWNGYTVELNPINSNNQFTVAYGRNNGYLNSNKMLSLNRPYALTLTHEQNLSKMYIDTNYENQQEVVPMNYTSTNLLIGKYNDTTLTKGNIYAIRMYNRALTQDEIKSNYEIDKIRFELENE